jgi:hypothetical protein
MLLLAAVLGLIGIAIVSLFGWGSLCRRTLRMQRGVWPTTVGLGLASVIFAGGILNLVRLAYPWALAGVVVIGVIVAVATFARDPGWRAIRSAPALVVVAVVLTVLTFAVLTQLRQPVYNFHDDFQKYFAHVTRMVQTGTVSGSLLNGIGSQTLGAQAFLQGFVVAFLPIAYINGLDSVLGLVLCLLLASQVAGRFSAVMTLLCLLSVVLIAPQQANVSALYTGAALIMAVVNISADPREASDPAAMGLLYAALIALKSTFALFVGLHLLAVVLSDWRRGIRAGLASVLFLLPWLLLSAPLYLAALRAPAPAALPGRNEPPNILELFSNDPLSYGSTALDYSFLMAAIGFCGLFAIWVADDRLRQSARMTAAACFSGVAAYVIQTLVLSPMNAGVEQAIRYCTPLAIGIAPAAFGLAALHASASPRLASWKLRKVLPLVLAAVPLAAFGSSLRDRVDEALKSGSVTALSWLAEDPDYVAYNREVLFGHVRKDVAKLQRLVPLGEPIIAWMNAPFYLDYVRNPIIDIGSGGLITPWAGTAQARYVIWDYLGFATKTPDDWADEMEDDGALVKMIADRSLHAYRRLEDLRKSGQLLYDDGRIAVIRFDGPTTLAKIGV